MKKIKSIICTLAIFGLVFPFSLGNVFSAGAVSTGVTVSVADTSLSATTSYTYGFTTQTALQATDINEVVVFSIQNWYSSWADSGAEILFTNATVGWVKDDGTALSLTNVQTQVFNNDQEIRIIIPGPLTIAAGSSISLKLSNVKNPSVAGNYSSRLSTGIDTPYGWQDADIFQSDNVIAIVIDKYIQGYVKYDTGGGVSSCSINANSETGQGWANANCDSAGFFRLALTETGNWRLHLDAKWEDGQRLTTDWIYEGMEQVVDVTGAGTFTKNFTVTKANATVKGKLVTPSGSVPLEPYSYWVDVRNEMGIGSGAGLNMDGTFSIPVKPGTYKISIHSPEPKYYIDNVKVSVGDNEIKNVGTLKLSEKTAQIKGRVVDANGKAISNLRMNMWGMNGWGEATTGTDGTYTMWAFPGEWEVRPDDWDASQKGYILSGEPYRASITKAGQEITGVNFTLKKSDAQINLNFAYENGAPVENMWGWAYCRKASAMPGPGNEFGRGIQGSGVEIPILGGETYVCGAHVDSYLGLSIKSEVEVSVAVGQTKSANITFLENDAEIVGYLRDSVTGEVITGVEGEVFAHGEGFGMGYHAFINQDGSYRMTLRNGTYFVGYNIRAEGFMQGDPDHSPVVVPPNGKVVKTIKVHRANAHINAKVLDPDGKPVAWAWVWCDNMKQKEEEMKGPFEGGEVLHTGGDTGGDGRARLGVLAGSYSCSAGLPPEFSSYMPPEMAEVTVTANEEKSITLQFRKSEGNLTGSVTMADGSQARMGFCHAWNPEGGFSGGDAFGGQFNIPLVRGTWYVGCDSMDGKKFYRSDETPITLSTVGETITKNFVLREASFELPEGISSTFDASQLTVINLPDGSSITIPANAIANEGNYTLAASPNVNLYHTPEAKPAIGFAWSLELTDSNGQSVTSNFNSDVVIKVKYNDEDLEAAGIDETKIIGRFWDENSSTWKLPENVIQDTSNNTVSIYVNHFTDFAITTGSQQGGSRTAKNIVTGAKAGAGPHLTMWDSEGNNEANFMAYGSNFRGGVTAISDDLDGDGINEIVTVPYSAGGPHVRVFNNEGENLANVFPYVMAFRGGLSLATGDVDGDGGAEIIVAPSENGGPHVRVYKYSNGALNHYGSFFAYAEGLRTGINVYAGDVNGDGEDEIVTATKTGAAPHVRIFKGDGTFVNHFFAFQEVFRGGVNVTLGDYSGNGNKDIVVSPASGGGPQYRVFNYQGGLLTSGFAYEETWRMGMKTGVGDVDGDSEIEIITAPSNGGPHVKVFGANGLESHFMAYANSFRGGVDLAVSDVDADGTAEIITAPMSAGGPHVKIQNATGGLIDHFMSHHSAFRGGVNLSISQ